MDSNLSRCTFDPGGEFALVEPGTTVLEAARSIGVPIQSPCNGRLVCGMCGVRIIDGELMPPEDDEAAKVGKSGVRLSCRARVAGDVTVRPVVTPRTRIVGAPKPVEKPEPVGAKEALDCSKAKLAAGIDLGTTTISVIVADADTNTVVGEARVPNLQLSFGADVLSRLSAAVGSDKSRIALRDAAQRSILEGLEVAVPGRLKDLSRITIAGNTVMASLLVGKPAQGLTSAPFEAPEDFALEEGPLVSALTACSSTLVLKPLAGFVGGDTVAGLVNTLYKEPELPLLFIDIGTNVEVALVSEDKITCASAPAGSAFAAMGSIGSDTLHSLLQLREAHILSAEGLLDESYEKVTRNDEGIMQVMAIADSTIGSDDGDPELRFITQLDIREFQLAKAAVAACVQLLLKASDLEPSQIESVYIAGTFGACIPTDTLFSLGILPARLEEVGSFVCIRDTAMDGALKISLDKTEDITKPVFSRKIVGLDLTSDPDFQDVLMSRLLLEPAE